MMADWETHPTSTHQDHVIAHVIGTTVKGYFLLDETAYLLLDIGFIWNIYLDGEMGLLLHPVVLKELGASETVKRELQSDVDILLGSSSDNPVRMIRVQSSPIQSVDFLARADDRRLELSCEHDKLVIKTSLATGEVEISSV